MSEMASKLILWVCPGNVAPNCAGQVGDVLVASAVTSYLQNEGWDIHFVTNNIMEKRLRDTYGFHVSTIIHTGSKTVLSQDDVEAARHAYQIFILRPFGDGEANAWQKQLVDGGVRPEHICRVGDLDAFAVHGPHICAQILTHVVGALPVSRTRPMFPLLSLESAQVPSPEIKERYLILPFAGGREKWLPTDTVVEIVRCLVRDGPICIAGTPFGDEPNGLQEIEDVLKSNSLVATCAQATGEEIALLAAQTLRVFCVDGGICWLTVAGLNWLVQNGRLSHASYPRVTVALGRDAAWNLAPAAAVWTPLAVNPTRIEQVNASQMLRLRDVPTTDIVR